MSHWYCRAVIRRWVYDHQPGFVECWFKDIFDHECVFIEKVPVVTQANLGRNSQLPQPAFIACRVTSWRKDETDRLIAQINTEAPWHIEATNGVTEFEVFADQLTESFDLGNTNSSR